MNQHGIICFVVGLLIFIPHNLFADNHHEHIYGKNRCLDAVIELAENHSAPPYPIADMGPIAAQAGTYLRGMQDFSGYLSDAVLWTGASNAQKEDEVFQALLAMLRMGNTDTSKTSDLREYVNDAQQLLRLLETTNSVRELLRAPIRSVRDVWDLFSRVFVMGVFDEEQTFLHYYREFEFVKRRETTYTVPRADDQFGEYLFAGSITLDALAFALFVTEQTASYARAAQDLAMLERVAQDTCVKRASARALVALTDVSQNWLQRLASQADDFVANVLMGSAFHMVGGSLRGSSVGMFPWALLGHAVSANGEKLQESAFPALIEMNVAPYTFSEARQKVLDTRTVGSSSEFLSGMRICLLSEAYGLDCISKGLGRTAKGTLVEPMHTSSIPVFLPVTFINSIPTPLQSTLPQAEEAAKLAQEALQMFRSLCDPVISVESGRRVAPAVR